MENNVMIYQSVITDIKDIISFGQEKLMMPQTRQWYLLIGM